MKRLIALFAVLLLVFAFGCANKAADTETTAPPSMEDVAGPSTEDQAPASGDVKINGMRQMEPMEMTVRAGAEIVFEKTEMNRNFRINIRSAEEKHVDGSADQLHGESAVWSTVLEEPGTYYFKETMYGGDEGVITVE